MSPKQKIAPNCNFFAIRDRREFPRSQIKAQKRSKMAILRLFSALRERRGVPNRKKVAKSSLFLFLRLADRRDGANPAKDESHTHRNQGMHLQSDKKPPEGGFVLKYMAGPAGFPRSASALPLGASACRQIPKNVPQTRFLYGISPHRFEPFASGKATKTARRRFRSQIYGWASRIRTYITGTKNQGPAIGRWPSVCHKAFCDYNVSGMVKPNKQPIRQNATTQYERRHATYRERRTYRALSSQNATALAAATLRESTPCAIGIFTV